MNVDITDLKTVRLSQDGSAVIILDQTRLPGSEVYVSLSSAEEVWEAIYKLKVRGAPAIGIAAAYGIYVCSRLIVANTYDSFYSEFLRMKDYLASSRPTAVNLVAALDRMEKVVVAHSVNSVSEIVELLRVEAEAIRAEDAAACRKIGENCLSLLRPGMGILTHCNAGHLAVSEYGTERLPTYEQKRRHTPGRPRRGARGNRRHGARHRPRHGDSAAQDPEAARALHDVARRARARRARDRPALPLRGAPAVRRHGC